MSQENVEIVRRGYEAYSVGDFTTLREIYDPDVVMHHLEGWPEPGPSVGREAVLREFEQLRETGEAQTLEVTDFVDAADRVVVRYAMHGSGRGPDVEMEFSSVYTLRNGKVVIQQTFSDHDEALKAAGLR
jgi:ketosteroid isomerase-like protein